MPIEWELPLRQRRGAQQRLGGLDVYYDFDWLAVFRHNRSTFPKGQSLAKLVMDECPDGKIPTLLLTGRTDVEAAIRETPERRVVIVPINDYLQRAGSDAATTYYARLAGTRLTQLSALANADFSAEELGSFLDRQLDAESLRVWAGLSAANRSVLTQVLQAVSDRQSSISSLLEAIGNVSEDEVGQVVAQVIAARGASGATEVMTVATASVDGREAASRILHDRLEARIVDARSQLTAYRALIAQDGVSETDIQRFLEAHPWIVGLVYVRVRPRVPIPRGALDFVLDRYDGFFDFLELKGPNDPIVACSVDDPSRPAPASAYSLGPTLSKALAQAHLYRANLDETRGLAYQYGLSDTRQPRIMIVIGRSEDLGASEREILRQLNMSLQRVEIITYDLLATRAEGWLRNIESLLAQSSNARTVDGEESLVEPA